MEDGRGPVGKGSSGRSVRRYGGGRSKEGQGRGDKEEGGERVRRRRWVKTRATTGGQWENKDSGERRSGSVEELQAHNAQGEGRGTRKHKRGVTGEGKKKRQRRGGGRGKGGGKERRMWRTDEEWLKLERRSGMCGQESGAKKVIRAGSSRRRKRPWEKDGQEAREGKVQVEREEEIEKRSQNRKERDCKKAEKSCWCTEEEGRVRKKDKSKGKGRKVAERAKRSGGSSRKEGESADREER
ncbi:hypothetical protein Tco_1327812 [Tanacetum coccineum]